MALINKCIRIAISPSSPLINFRSVPDVNPCRVFSSDTPRVPPSGGNNPSDPTIYDYRKYGHRLPDNNVCPNFHVLPEIPSGIFRCTAGEVLGLGAGKCCFYKNPEYFSFHHMSFYDLHLHLRKYRLPCPKTNRKAP